MASFDIRESVTFDDGQVIVRREQPDLDAFLAENHELAVDGAKSVGPAKFRLVGRIPMVIYEQWMRECGAPLGSAELAEYIKRKLLSGEFSKLAVKGY